MSQNGTALGFVFGAVFGAAVGAVAGMLLAPRSGAESRAMAADAMNDAWDAAVDTYEKRRSSCKFKECGYSSPDGCYHR